MPTHSTAKTKTGTATTNLSARTARAKKIVRTLRTHFPDAHIALNFDSPWELAVAVILSAQCTDKKVNEVTAHLFDKYKTLDDYIAAKPDEFAQDIRQTGFYRAKAKNILAAARKVHDEFGGVLPRTMQELLTIPGIARKTANVLLGNLYGVVEGIAVDTHVKRYAQKFDLTDFADPVRIERDLMAIIPKKDWMFITYGLIEYGRQICPARTHECAEHPLTKLFPKAATIWPKAK